MTRLGSLCFALVFTLSAVCPTVAAAERRRVLVETDAGGDPDDEQSLVRFLLYCNEWDVEGIIANRPMARPEENRNVERTGLGVVRRLLRAYAECYPKLVQHDARYPKPELLFQRTVAGYDDGNEGVRRILAAVDAPDPRPLWYSDWGTDHGAATNNLNRALDRVLRERGPDGYAKFKRRLRLSSYDRFGEHTTTIEPPFPLWVDTFRPEQERKRWYHRFSALTASAGGFDLVRDVLTGHGPLGALYPTNTTHWAKEGDSMTFLYLVPTGMNDPEQPTWGSWAGRSGRMEPFADKPYYWANQADAWNGSTNRDNTLRRWAAHLQNDFKARLDWCVNDFSRANHPPAPRVRWSGGRTGGKRLATGNEPRGNKAEPFQAGSDNERNGMVTCAVASGARVAFDAGESTDPDEHRLRFEWVYYPEPGTYRGPDLAIHGVNSPRAWFVAPETQTPVTLHIVLMVTDNGEPPLTRYRRVVVEVARRDAAPSPRRR